MGLCGSARCGCALTSSPATSGAINGQLPSIEVTGSGQPGDPWDLTLNDTWSAAVVDAINLIQLDLEARGAICVVNAPSQNASNAVYDPLFFSGTVESDPRGWINPGNQSQFKPDISGWYDIGCSVSIGTPSTVTAAEMRKNGSLVRRQDNGAAFSNPDFYIRDVVYLNGTTDYVTIESFQGSGSTQTHAGRIAARWVAP